MAAKVPTRKRFSPSHSNSPSQFFSPSSFIPDCCKANPPNARKLPSKKSGSMKLQRDRRLEFHRLALMAFPSEFKGCSGDQCCDSGGGSKTTAAAAAERSLLSGERPNASTGIQMIDLDIIIMKICPLNLHGYS